MKRQHPKTTLPKSVPTPPGPAQPFEGGQGWDAYEVWRTHIRTQQETRFSVEQIRQGLPMRALDELATALKLDSLELADILGISARTLQRKAHENDRLGATASDRLSRIRRILDLASHVFGSADKASKWLTSRSRPLGGEIPLRMLDTDIGSQRVQQELRQIEFGMSA